MMKLLSPSWLPNEGSKIFTKIYLYNIKIFYSLIMLDITMHRTLKEGGLVRIVIVQSDVTEIGNPGV